MLSSQPDIPAFPPSEMLSNEPPSQTYRHLQQLILLLTSLEWLWRDRTDFFAGGNLSIYYSTREHKSGDFRGLDFFVVLDTERKERKSWVVWEEDGKYPNFILEVLSDSTAQIDQGLKKQIYQDIFRTPDYFRFHPYTLELKGFKRTYRQYEEIQPNEHGWLWSEELQLFLGMLNKQLRFFTPDGNLVLTPPEAATQQIQQIETEWQRAGAAEAQVIAERQRVEQLLQQLRLAGIDPDRPIEPV
ncbi:MAG: Uma2 family endonuclease [Scytolyngbya sp. HA4215-MV1]|jgi:Uma2 family endonuclease|nr:Uma2 family endonuclease [Scytolyngbya sp. HA4215-MV1]